MRFCLKSLTLFVAVVFVFSCHSVLDTESTLFLLIRVNLGTGFRRYDKRAEVRLAFVNLTDLVHFAIIPILKLAVRVSVAQLDRATAF